LPLSSPSSIASPNASPHTYLDTATTVKLCSILQTINDPEFSTCIPIPDTDPRKQLRLLGTKVPSNAAAPVTKRSIRLNVLLSRVIDQATNQRLALDRKQRFGIAAALAWAALHLCDSPWLGDALNENEVYLFLEEDGRNTAPRLSKHPYLSCSFSLPSSPSPGKISTNAGAHTKIGDPVHSFEDGQVQNATLYSLAIRLIELGLNKPFAKLRQEYHASNPSVSYPSNTTLNTPDSVDDYEIAKQQVTELILDAGTSYGHAVDRCLRSLFPGPATMNTFEHRSFRSTFFADVVAPIQMTYELIPGSSSDVLR
jgi:hypothetical protein